MTATVVATTGAACLIGAAFWVHPALGLAVVGLMLLVAGLFFDFGSE